MDVRCHYYLLLTGPTSVISPIGLSDHNSVVCSLNRGLAKNVTNKLKIWYYIHVNKATNFGKWLAKYNWSALYRSVTYEDKLDIFMKVIKPLQPEPSENQFEFNECYIEFNISISKSLGSDGIQNWVLKDYAYILALPVASLFNASIQQQHVLTVWKKVEVISIPKTSQLISVLFHRHRPCPKFVNHLHPIG